MKNKTEGSILLDTHIWIWFAESNYNFSKSLIQLIDTSIKTNTICVSAISLWEISMLAAREKIILSLPTQDWLESSIKKLNLDVIPITPHIAVESTVLPGEFHKDPADRLIVATARCEKLNLITADKEILHYSENHYVRTIAVA